MSKHPYYLSAIQIEHFRAFANSQTIKLNGKPGLTLLLGANGLGKSSCLEAIEWALTGGIGRVAGIDKNSRELAHRNVDGKVSGGPAVCLSFLGANSAEISLARTIADAPDLAPISGNYVKDFATLYGLTHHLSQSSLLRVQQMDEQALFLQLKAAQSGFDLDQVNTNLSRRGTTNAIRDALAELDRKINETKNSQSLVAQWRAALQREHSAESLSPDEYRQRLSIAMEAISNVLEPDTRQRWKQATHQQISGELTSLRGRLALAATQQAQWLDGAATRQRNQEKMTALQTQLADKRAAEAKAKADQSAWESMERTSALGLQLTQAKARAGGLESAITEQDAAHFRLAQMRSECLEKQHNARIKFSQSQATSDAFAVYARAELALKNLQRVNDELDANYREIVGLQARIADMQLGIDEHQAQMELQTQRLSQTRADFQAKERSSDAIQQALMALLAHITDTTEHCPLCQSQFALGQLKSAALHAIAPSGELDALKSKLDQDAADLDELHNKILSLTAALQNENAQLNKFLNAAFAVLGDVESANIAVGDASEFLQLQDAQLRLETRIAADTQSLQSLHTQLAIADDFAGKRLEVDSARRAAQLALNARIDEVAAAERSIAALNATLAQLRQERADAVKLISVLTNKISETGAASQSVAELQARYGRMSAAEIAPVVRELGDEAAALNAEMQDYQRQLDHDLSLQQQAFGDAPADQAALRALQGKQAALRAFGVVLLALENAQRAYAQNLAIQGVRSSLEELVRTLSTTDLDLETTLQSNLNSLETQKIQVKQFDTQREVISTRLKELVIKKQKQFLAPLETSVNAVAQLLLCKHRGLRTIIKSYNTYSTSKASMHGMMGEHEYNLIAMRSEGEQAADNLCFQIAASLTYPWCPWRALILDDPLQHNDVVHTSAYADLIRRLILERKYQIFHSTHDLDQARYLAQKCRHAGIAVNRILFVGRDEKGPIIEQSLSESRSSSQAFATG